MPTDEEAVARAIDPSIWDAQTNTDYAAREQEFAKARQTIIAKRVIAALDANRAERAGDVKGLLTDVGRLLSMGGETYSEDTVHRIARHVFARTAAAVAAEREACASVCEWHRVRIAAAVAMEREACANVCLSAPFNQGSFAHTAATMCADAIRARGK